MTACCFCASARPALSFVELLQRIRPADSVTLMLGMMEMHGKGATGKNGFLDLDLGAEMSVGPARPSFLPEKSEMFTSDEGKSNNIVTIWLMQRLHRLGSICYSLS